MLTSTHLRLIVATILVTAFSPSVVAAQVLESVDSLVVVDANQNRVGKVMDIGRGNRMGTPEVPLKYGDFLFIVRVLKTRFVGGGHGSGFNDQTLWFDEPGCTGQAYMDPVIQGGGFPDGIGPRSIIGVDGGTVYMEDLAGQALEFFDAFSSLLVRDNVPRCDEHPGGNRTVGPVVPTVQVVNLFTFFMPPFSMQAEAGQDLTALQQQADDLTTQVEALTDENAKIQQQLSDLGEGFTNHTHTYQTGRPRFHNRVTATTGPAMLAVP